MTAHTATNIATAAPRGGLLRGALRVDALASLASAVLSIALAGQLPVLMGAGAPAFYLGLGAALLLYAVFLLWLAAQPRIGRRAALVPIVLNTLWVIDSAALLLSGWVPLTAAGFWTVVVLADLVVALAVAQYIGLRRAA